MNELLAWLPWIIGVVLVFLIVRFIAGLVVRLVMFGVLLLVVYFVWQALAGT